MDYSQPPGLEPGAAAAASLAEVGRLVEEVTRAGEAPGQAEPVAAYERLHEALVDALAQTES